MPVNGPDPSIFSVANSRKAREGALEGLLDPALMKKKMADETAMRAKVSKDPALKDLADAMDVNYQTIGFLERGDYSPSLKLALALGEYFGLPVEAIFSKQPLEPLSLQVYRVRPEQTIPEIKR